MLVEVFRALVAAVGAGAGATPALGLPFPQQSAQFVVVGLTNGPAFHPNPCLVSQVAFARERGLHASAYAVVTYPTKRQLRRYGASAGGAPAGQTRLWNTGWAQAKVNVAEMRAAGPDSPAMWVGVEPVTKPAPGSRHLARHRPGVAGARPGHRDAGPGVGRYSGRSLWRRVGGNAPSGLPGGRSAGPRSGAAARAMCRSGSFNGGPAVIAQWWDDRRDHDLL